MREVSVPVRIMFNTSDTREGLIVLWPKRCKKEGKKHKDEEINSN